MFGLFGLRAEIEDDSRRTVCVCVCDGKGEEGERERERFAALCAECVLQKQRECSLPGSNW